MSLRTSGIGTVPELETQIVPFDAEDRELADASEREGTEVKRQTTRVAGRHGHATVTRRYVSHDVGHDIDR
jgi:hypothetical protein